ncbi:MAG: noncanonical pyrimidine nucleotidase, YjjG family [Bacteroidetes bacterium]|nr:MAG: noncanonical pyrimidine nucleotidase, YjjG family [Bacteroidota bacterium]
MQKKYRHLFFDLDRTLWDFDKSAAETFEDIYNKYKLLERGIKTVEDFHRVYTHHNNILWEEYRHGRIEKKVLSNLRYFLTLQDFDIEDEKLAADLGKDYLEISPRKVNLFPNAISVLNYLSPRYTLHLITNGFSEVQETKLRVSGLGEYFRTVITSEEAGVKKPNPAIFYFALKKADADIDNSLMIGDDFEVDIVGAKNVGIDQVLFDPEQKYQQNGSTFTIRDLAELKGFL